VSTEEQVKLFPLPGKFLSTFSLKLIRRVFYASQMSAKPRLLEPVYLVDIQCSSKALNGVYSTLNKRRGVVTEAVPKIGNSLYVVKGFLPVSESFGFVALLRSETSGQAFPQLVFDHWEVIEEDPLEDGSRANVLVKDIRKRKGMEIEIPPLDHYMDKL
jgi:elongation factor 2